MWGNMYQSELCEVMPVNDTKTNLGQLNTEQHKCSDNSHIAQLLVITTQYTHLTLTEKSLIIITRLKQLERGFLQKFSL